MSSVPEPTRTGQLILGQYYDRCFDDKHDICSVNFSPGPNVDLKTNPNPKP